MSSTPVIFDEDGIPGTVVAVTKDRIQVQLPSGTELDLPATLADHQPDGSYRVAVSFGELDPGERYVLPEVEERVQVRRKIHDTGRVVAHVRTEVRHEDIDTSGWRETIEVERVPVGREVEAVQSLREEGGVTVIPVYEEVLVIHKKLVLREEIRLKTRREPTPGSERVTLRRQRVDVERHAPTP